MSGSKILDSEDLSARYKRVLLLLSPAINAIGQRRTTMATTTANATTMTLVQEEQRRETTAPSNEDDTPSSPSSLTATLVKDPLEPPETDKVVMEPPYSVFTSREKWGIVLLVSTAGLFSPLSGNIYLPSIPLISRELGTSIEQINLTVTYYMIFQGITPTFWGAICDVLGRRPVYISTFSLYILACLVLSQTHSYPLLVTMRCLQATGSASVIAIGAGSIGDLARPRDRGLYMGVFSLGPMAGGAIGPVIGGLLSDHYGWQSVFYFLSAFGVIVLLIMVVVLPETLRSIVGNGSITPPRRINRSLLSLLSSTPPPKQGEDMKGKGWRDIDPLAPFKMFKEKDVLLILTFNSVMYTLFYTVITSTSTLLKQTYNLSETSLGLSFLANGGGCLLASIINGPRMNRDYRIVAEQVRAAQGGEVSEGNDLKGFPIEHARLRSLPYSFVILIASTIAYGWTLQAKVNLAVPLICQFFIGLTVTTQFNCISTLLVDLYPTQSASATAANNFYRCLLGAAGTAGITPLLDALGAGWSFTLLSLLACLFVPLIVLEWKCGERYRAERAGRVLAREEMKAGKSIGEGEIEKELEGEKLRVEEKV